MEGEYELSNLPDNPVSLAWNFYQDRWPYDEFVPNYILKPMKLSFVPMRYDRPLAAFVQELPEVMHHFNTIRGPGDDTWFEETIRRIEKAGLPNLFAFLERVTTRTQAEAFLAVSGIPQACLMAWMDYLKQWWFPYPATLSHLVGEGNLPLEAALARLKAAKIGNSLTLLEAAAEPDKRADLARRLGIDAGDLLDLVHRADVSRLPYTSGGAVKRLWVMGYRNLAAIRAVDLQEYINRIEAYFSVGGKGTTFDSRPEIIQGFLADARHAPEVVDVK